MPWLHLVALAVLLIAGATAAAPYPSVADAIQARPELSSVAGMLRDSALARTLADPDWIGTVFLPTNDALAALTSKLGGDFQSFATSDPNQAADVFGYAIVPGRALLSSALLPGQKLNTAINGTLLVTRSSTATLINGIPLAAANIPAGKAIVHELSSVLLPPDVADLLQAANNDTVDPFASDTIAPADGDDAAVAATGTTTPALVAVSSAATPTGSAADDAAAKAKASAAAPVVRAGSALMAAAAALPLLLAML